jgi:hypothetical protein
VFRLLRNWPRPIPQSQMLSRDKSDRCINGPYAAPLFEDINLK